MIARRVAGFYYGLYFECKKNLAWLARINDLHESEVKKFTLIQFHSRDNGYKHYGRNHWIQIARNPAQECERQTASRLDRECYVCLAGTDEILLEYTQILTRLSVRRPLIGKVINLPGDGSADANAMMALDDEKVHHDQCLAGS